MEMFLSYTVVQALVTFLVLRAGRWLSRAMNLKSPLGRERGRVVAIWAATCYFLGAMVGGTLGYGNKQAMSETGAGLGGMALLVGVIVGNIQAIVTIRPDSIEPKR